jgi:hypothetical protein
MRRAKWFQRLINNLTQHYAQSCAECAAKFNVGQSWIKAGKAWSKHDSMTSHVTFLFPLAALLVILATARCGCCVLGAPLSAQQWHTIAMSESLFADVKPEINLSIHLGLMNRDGCHPVPYRHQRIDESTDVLGTDVPWLWKDRRGKLPEGISIDRSPFCALYHHSFGTLRVKISANLYVLRYAGKITSTGRIDTCWLPVKISLLPLRYMMDSIEVPSVDVWWAGIKMGLFEASQPYRA